MSKVTVKVSTIRKLQKAKQEGRKLSMVTANDATFARVIDSAGVDAILVGDSLGNVIQGQSTTLPVTLEHMIYHCQAVMRGVDKAHVVGDMPFMTYQVNADEALRNAGRLMAEGGVHAVKLEGGRSIAPIVARIVEAGIPVMGHLGLTPQSVHALGGFRVQGRAPEAADRLLEDALALQDAGAYAIVVEMVPADLGRRLTESLSIPTIGIGAGPHCDGQVLVCYDLLGMNLDFTPKFLKTWANLAETVQDAVAQFDREVKEGQFPTDDHSF